MMMEVEQTDVIVDSERLDLNIEFSLIRSIIVESFVRKTKDYTCDTSVPIPKTTFVCFPFRENYHRNSINAVPCLSSHFVDDQKWNTFATEYLSARSMMANTTSYVPPCMHKYRYCEVDKLPEKKNLPFQLTDSVTIEEILFETSISIIYKIKVHQPGSNIRYECIAKLVNIRKSSPFWKWHDSRQSIGKNFSQPKRLRSCPAWSESISLSKVYPSRFLGNATFFNRADGYWYSAIFMPYYRGTLWSLVEKVLPLFQINGVPKPECINTDGQVRLWPSVLLASLMQIILYTIPKAKKSHLVSHNDLKIDNIAYKKTSRKFVYVQINTTKGRTILAIPTYGRMFTLIDFGWASLSCTKENIQISSTCPRYSLSSTMKVWNFCTDFAQVAYSLWRRLQEYFNKDLNELYSLDESWWDLLDALALLSYTDDGTAVLKVTRHNWETAFYSASSINCHFKSASEFVALANTLYQCSIKSIPKKRLVVEYDIGLLSSHIK